MKEKPVVLLVDDEPSLCQVLTILLEEEGFSVITASDGEEGLRLAMQQRPDLVLLDIMLPRTDGREVCRRLRQVSDVPIIMLTCMPTLEEKVGRLVDGADDYVTKPFDNNELVARMRAVLRRAQRREASQRVYDDGYLRVNLESHQVFVNGDPVTLSPKEWRLLEYFLQHKNRVVPHQALLRYAWGDGYEEELPSLKVYIAHLRRKLGDSARRPRYIHSERTLGYRFETHT
ncbi:MAG: response regulator transcription factor [Anaerolineae bacterium]|nr:response regulator transcription factor [Anaerolineae bacterium]